MDYKEKYEEALERAKIWQEHLYEVGDKDYADELNYIFPELKESWDEMIRKNIISLVNAHGQGRFKESMLDWLEKQGDKKYIDDLTQQEAMDIAVAKCFEQGEQKSAWSEADEYTLNETIQHLKLLIEIDKAKHCACDVQYYQRDIDWLKSIKQRIGG